MSDFLETIKARCAAASLGPWGYGTPPRGKTRFKVHTSDEGPCDVAWVIDAADAEFIAHARTDVAALVAEVERTRALLKVEVAGDPTLQRRLFEECETAGWDPDKQLSFAEEIAHLHEEVSEAFREFRRHKNFEVRFEPDGKPTGIPVEFADVLIGLFYNAELHAFDLLEAVEVKHQYNLTRSYADEGRRLHD